MKGLRVGLFSDGELRDHSYTLRGLRDAMERSKFAVRCFDVMASDKASHERLREALQAPFSFVDGIALDLELGSVPGFSSLLFALDSASRLNILGWTEAEMDDAASMPRLVALDVRAWVYYRGVFGRDVPLLPAPLPSFGGLAHGPSGHVVVIVNDPALSDRSLPEVRRAVQGTGQDFEIVEIVNEYRSPVTQSAWLDPRLLYASAHIHIGQPLETVSCGRLIDSMNMRAPCIVLDDALLQRDGDVGLTWSRPSYVNDVNLVRTTSVSALAGAIRLVLQDRAWSGNLVRNALREVAAFQERFETMLIEPFATETASWSAG